MRHFNDLERGHVILSRYCVEEKIGQGRSSAVYRAVDRATEAPVALKILDPFLAQDEANVERFRREVEVIRSLRHPHIIKLYDLFQDAELRVICMEFVEGRDLAHYLQDEGPMPIRVFSGMIRSMLSAMDACHREMVLHRDIKPQNILVDRHGEIRLVDFGVSKINSMSDLTKTGTAVGSPEYMAPELFRSTRADPRSDIYALGAVMYEMLTGRPPYGGDSLASIMFQQLEAEIPSAGEQREDVPHWIDSIVRKCLRTDPDDRYQSIAEVLAEFDRQERALSTYERSNQPVPCLRCGSARIPGLPFCHDCGAQSQECFDAGDASIAIYRADEPELLQEAIVGLFPGADLRRLRRRLGRGPALLIRGINEDSAQGLFNQLAPLYCELSVLRQLPRELRLPSWLAFLGIGVFGVLYAMLGKLIGVSVLGAGFKDILLAVPAMAISQGVIFGSYWWRTRPLLSASRAKVRESAAPSALNLRLAETIRAIGLSDLRRTLGHMAASLIALKGREKRLAPVSIDDAEALVFRSCRTAAALEGLELYLGERTLMGIAGQLDAVEIKLARAQDSSEIEKLVDEKLALQSELKEFHAVQDRHARATMALLNARGTLEKLRNAVQCGEGAGALADEVQDVSGHLQLCAEDEAERDPGASDCH